MVVVRESIKIGAKTLGVAVLAIGTAWFTPDHNVVPLAVLLIFLLIPVLLGIFLCIGATIIDGVYQRKTMVGKVEKWIGDSILVIIDVTCFVTAGLCVAIVACALFCA